MALRRCKACGDPIENVFEEVLSLQRMTRQQRDVFYNYCRECAEEIVFGKVSPIGAKLDSCGAGCPLEGHPDEPTPWQEIAIRRWEDARVD